MKPILVLCLISGAAFGADVTFLSSYSWQGREEAFGGFSSLHLDDKGKSFLATSDRGHFMSGEIFRVRGEVIGVINQRIFPILDKKGKKVRKSGVDAEGLAVGSDGRIYVSFERKHQVWAFENKVSLGKELPKHSDFKKLQENSSLEALAIDAGGRLYAIPERSGEIDRPFPVYRFDGNAWDKYFSIPRRGEFLVTGADFGPDGNFYLLERKYASFRRVSTRIRRFKLTDKGFIGEKVILETRYGTHDNLEGISVWRDDRNRLRITMISDDNFNVFQRTEFVEYVID